MPVYVREFPPHILGSQRMMALRLMAEHILYLLQVLCTLSACCWLLTGVWPRTGERGPSISDIPCFV